MFRGVVGKPTGFLRRKGGGRSLIVEKNGPFGRETVVKKGGKKLRSDHGECGRNVLK